jgi:CheY-like chemotaxis protein
MAKVLVVDDEPVPLRLMVQVLNMLGHEVRGAGNGGDALTIATEFRPDVLLSDWLLEETTGLDVALAVRDVAPQVRTLFITGFPRETVSAQAAQVTRWPVLEKPLGLEALSEAIRRVLTENPPGQID